MVLRLLQVISFWTPLSALKSWSNNTFLWMYWLKFLLAKEPTTQTTSRVNIFHYIQHFDLRGPFPESNSVISQTLVIWSPGNVLLGLWNSIILTGTFYDAASQIGSSSKFIISQQCHCSATWQTPQCDLLPMLSWIFCPTAAEPWPENATLYQPLRGKSFTLFIYLLHVLDNAKVIYFIN